MRNELTLLALVALAALTLYSLKAERGQSDLGFEMWKLKFHKRYSPQEEAYRLKVWLSNRDYIETHNRRYEAGLESYSLKMNHFGDLPLEEFKAIYLTKKSS